MRYFHQREQLTPEMKEALGVRNKNRFEISDGMLVRGHRNWVDQWINDDWVILGHQNRGGEPSYSLWERSLRTRKLFWRPKEIVTSWILRGSAKPDIQRPADPSRLCLIARSHLEFDCLDHNMDACQELERMNNE